MKQSFYQFVTGLVFVLTTQVALAYYVDVPAFQPSWRGLAHTTLQKWSFSSIPTNGTGEGDYYGPEVTVADVRSNPNGMPSAYIIAQQAGVGWVYGDAGSMAQFSASNYGWWDLGANGGGHITLTIPSAGGSAGSIRYLWLQVTEAIFAGQFEPATITVAGGTQVGSTQTQQIEEYNPAGSTIDFVTVYQMVWQVPGDTTSDTITITGATTGGKDSIIGGIVVDTSGHPPVANDVTYARATNMTWKIKVSNLMTNAAPRDVGDTLSFVSVSGGSHGSVGLIAGGTYVGYTPNQPDQNLTDSFTYTVKDDNNGLQSSGTVTLNVIPQAGGQATEITVSGSEVSVKFAGIPGYQYDVQRATEVNFTSPTVILTTNAPADGLFICVDSSPPTGTAFYRLKKH